MGPPDPTPRWLDLGGRVPVADERVADCWVGWGWAREPRPPARSGGDRDDPSLPESAGLGHPWPLSFLSILHPPLEGEFIPFIQRPRGNL